jgi:hypothetical protein
MGINNSKRVWVGVIGGWMAGYFDVKVSTALKGLCEEIGTNYLTAKDKLPKDSNGPVTLYSGVGVEKRAWSVIRVKVRKVAGRGKGG